MSSAQLESSGTTAITRGHQTLSAHLGPRVLRYLALLLAGALALAVALSGLSGLNPAGAAISSDVGDVDERLYATAPHILYDLGVRTNSVFDESMGRATAAFVPFFTDCAPDSLFAGCGPPPARWIVGDAPVDFCTFQTNRAASVSAELFRDTVQDAADIWNAIGAAVGVRYIGDCPSGDRWIEGNGVNEISFDDGRNVVTGAQAGVTTGTWRNTKSPAPPPGRSFVEADIVIDEGLDIPPACFHSVITHELGHALGFGHSDSKSDLMFSRFIPSDLSTCHNGPSAEEQVRLQELYGVDQQPTVSVGPDRIVEAGQSVILSATASDPEGKQLSYKWSQISGEPVTLSQDGAGVVLVAPDIPGARLHLQAAVLDPFLHRAVDSLLLTVISAEAPPASLPSFVSFLPNISRSSAVLGWTTIADATSFEFCSGVVRAAALDNCDSVDVPEIEVSWDTVLDSGGSVNTRRVFTEPVRDTSLAACNVMGCTAAGFGPLAGGLRWEPWAIDFDYLAFAFDVRSTRWTVVAVVNLSDEPRNFVFRSGPLEAPSRLLLHGCGSVQAGGVCIGWLSPHQAPHDPVVTIVSSADGTPTTEHRITVR